jgi:hypothetical protein
VNIEKIMPTSQLNFLFDEKVTGFDEKQQQQRFQLPQLVRITTNFPSATIKKTCLATSLF